MVRQRLPPPASRQSQAASTRLPPSPRKSPAPRASPRDSAAPPRKGHQPEPEYKRDSRSNHQLTRNAGDKRKSLWCPKLIHSTLEGGRKAKGINQLAARGWNQQKAAHIPGCLLHRLPGSYFSDYIERTTHDHRPPCSACKEISGLLPPANAEASSTASLQPVRPSGNFLAPAPAPAPFCGALWRLSKEPALSSANSLY